MRESTPIASSIAAVGDRGPDQRAEPRPLHDDVDREREGEPDADQRQPVDRVRLPGDVDAAVEAGRRADGVDVVAESDHDEVGEHERDSRA